MLGLLTTILGGWVGGGWVLDLARLKLTQPSLAGAGAELGKNWREKNGAGKSAPKIIELKIQNLDFLR